MLTPTTCSGDYNETLWRVIKDVEGYHSITYLDGKGLATIGFGFNMEGNPDVLEKVLLAFGFNLDPEAMNNDLPYKTEIETALKLPSESEIRTKLDEIMSRWAGTNPTRRTSFYLDPSNNYAEAESVFFAAKSGFDAIVDAYCADKGISSMIGSNERIVLFSLAYNGYPHTDSRSLLGNKLATAIKNDDRPEAWYEIRYNSNKLDLINERGLAKRRYYESQIFGLYTEGLSHEEEIEEYKKVFRMFNKHEESIRKYDTEFHERADAANSDYTNRICTVQQRDPAFQIAKSSLEAEYVDEMASIANDAITAGAVNDVVASASFFLLDEVFTAHEGAGVKLARYNEVQEAGVNTVDRTVAGKDAARDLIFSGLRDKDDSGNKITYTLKAGKSDDIIVAGKGKDTVDGGDGNDILSFQDSDASLIIDLQKGTFTGGHAEGDTYTNVEGYIGSNHADTFVGDDNANFLVGAGGNDSLKGGGGDDVLGGGGGNDTLIGEAGNDILHGGEGDDMVDYSLEPVNGTTFTLAEEKGRLTVQTEELGKDTLIDVEHVIGSNGEDLFILKDDNFGDVVTIEGGEGTDTLDLSSFSSGAFVNVFSSSQALNEFSGLRDFEAVKGSNFADTIIGGSNTTFIDGGQGDDIVGVGGIGSTKVFGGEGNDTLRGGFGSILQGDGGSDTFYATHGVLIHADATDRILIGEMGLTGAIKWEGISESSYAYNNAQGVKYAMNDEGDLVITNVLKWTTFIADYVSPLEGDATAGINVVKTELSHWRLCEFQGNPTDTTVSQSVYDIIKWSRNALTNANLGTDPLALDLDGDGLELEALTRGVSPIFDIDNDMFAEQTGWVRGDDGLLAHDANGDGQINNITELFGDATTSGFTELAAFDSNGDQIIDAADANFSDLRVWRDLDGDAITDEGELLTLDEAGVKSISLSTTESGTENAGHIIARTASFTRTDDSTGVISDVNFMVNNIDTVYLGDTTVSPEAEALPNLPGYGVLPNLHISATQKPALIPVLEAAVLEAPTTLAGVRAMILPVLRAWAADHNPGVGSLHYLYTENTDSTIEIQDIAIYDSSSDSWTLQSGREIVDELGDPIIDPDLADIQAMAALDPDAVWGVFESADIAFLEQFLGQDVPITPENLARPLAGDAIEGYLETLYELQNNLGVAFAVQGGLSSFFEHINYDVESGLYTSSLDSQQLTPLFTNILNASSQTDAAVATSYLQEWEPILDVFVERFNRGDSSLHNTFSYQFSNLVSSYESVGHGVLSISEAAAALDIRAIIEGTGTITGTSDPDIFYMGPGDQNAQGGEGPDAYVFGSNFGQDVIDDREAAPYGDDYDIIRFATYTTSDITATRDGVDLILTVDATGDSVRVLEQFKEKRPIIGSGYGDDDRGVKEIIFADGEVWDKMELAHAVSHPLDTDDHLIGTTSFDYLDGGLGNDTLSGGDNIDVYRFNLGSGNDVVEDNMEYVLFADDDYIEFGNGIAWADLTFTRQGNSDDLSIGITGHSDTLLVKGQFEAHNTGSFEMYWPNRIENLAFQDYSMYRWTDVMDRMLDEAKTEGDDTIYGFYRQDTLDGGAGNDFLQGGDDGDTYLFDRGYGQDIILDGKQIHLTATDDRVLFGEGLSPDDIQLSRNGASGDLTISIAGSDETLTIQNQFVAAETGSFGLQWYDRIETFEFQDAASTIWTWEDIMQRLVSEGTTDGDDTIHGFHYADTLDGGAGNDTLKGGAESDVYKYGIGSGDDVILDDSTNILTANNDRVEFGEGITFADLDVTSADSGEDLVLTIRSTGETLTLDQQFERYAIGGAWFAIEEFHFTDGTVMTSDEFLALVTIGTDNDETIHGSDFDDTFNGSLGNDTLYGRSGSDTYIFNLGDGQDTIHESVSNVQYPDDDKIVFGTGISSEDILVSRAGDDLILSIDGTTDQLTIANCFFTIYDQVEEFHFDDGTIWTIGDVISMLVTGTSGDDTLLGTDQSRDRLDGKEGNDLLKGGSHGDTYVFDVGYGQDVVYDVQTNILHDTPDRVEFGPGIGVDDLVLSRAGNDLVVEVSGTSDKLTVQSMFHSAGYEIEEFVFSDGTTWSMDDVQAMLLAGTSGDDSLIGYNGRADYFDGGTGDDTMQGKGAGDTYLFDIGYENDVVYDMAAHSSDPADKIVFGAGITSSNISFSRSGDDLVFSVDGASDTLTIDRVFLTQYQAIEEFHFNDGTVWTLDDIQGMLIAGTDGDDSLVGFNTRNDTLSGGLGDDTLVGGKGSDVYEYNIGDGTDVIRDSGNSGDVDLLRFGVEITPDDITVAYSTTDGNDIVFELISGDSITLDEQDSYTWNGIDSVEFNDGTIWDKDSILAKAAGEEDPTGEYTVTHAGTAGDDTLTGTSGEDVLEGGAGNDSVQGGNGSDVYLFNLGDGQDTIYDYGTSSSNDKLVFGSELLVNDLTVLHNSSDTDDITLQFASGDSILLNEQDYNTYSGIEQIEFADGTIWDYDDIKSTYLEQAKTSGDDSIIGFKGADTLEGGIGNDTIKGGNASDTYIFNAGDGNDTLYDYGTSSSADKLILGAGLISTEVTVLHSSTDRDDVTLQFATGDSIMLNEQDYNIYSGIDQVDFADGVTWTFVDMKTVYLSQAKTSGDDLIDGFKGSDTLNGGQGSDTLAGWNGNDTYLFNLGDQHARIHDYGSSSTDDKLVFGAGITAADVMVTWDADDADDILLTLSSGDTVYLNEQDYTSYYGVEQVIFNDGTIWTKPDLVSMANTPVPVSYNITGSEGDDILSGGSLNDTLRGESGSDTLYGNEGKDTLYGGDGDDLLDGGDGNDWLEGGAGDDTLLGGTGMDFLVGGEGADVLDGGDGNDYAYYASYVSSTAAVNVNLATGICTGGHAEGDTLINLERLTGSSYNDTLVGDLGDNYLSGQSGDDILSGGEGTDLITGDGGNDTLRGGSGSDYLHGKLDDDTYQFGIGDDIDIVYEEGGVDTVQFLQGISEFDLWFYTSANKLAVGVIGTDDRLFVDSWFTQSEKPVETFELSDGAVLLDSQVQLLVDAMSAYTPSTSGTLSVPDSIQDDVQSVITSSWTRT